MMIIPNSLINGLSATYSQIKANPKGTVQFLKKMLKINTTTTPLCKAKYAENKFQLEKESPPPATLKIKEFVTSISVQQKPTALTLTAVQLSTPLPERRFDLAELLGLRPTSFRAERPTLSAPVAKLAEQLNVALRDFERSKTINPEAQINSAKQPECDAEMLQHTGAVPPPPPLPPLSPPAVKTRQLKPERALSEPATVKGGLGYMDELTQRLAQINPETFENDLQPLPELSKPKPKKTLTQPATEKGRLGYMDELRQRLAQIHPEALDNDLQPEPKPSNAEPVSITNTKAVVSQPTQSAPPPPPPLPPQNQPAVKIPQPKLKRELSEPAIIDPRQAMIMELEKRFAQRNPLTTQEASSTFHRTKSESDVATPNNNHINIFEEDL